MMMNRSVISMSALTLTLAIGDTILEATQLMKPGYQQFGGVYHRHLNSN